MPVRVLELYQELRAGEGARHAAEMAAGEQLVARGSIGGVPVGAPPPPKA